MGMQVAQVGQVLLQGTCLGVVFGNGAPGGSWEGHLLVADQALGLLVALLERVVLLPGRAFSAG